VKLTTSLSFCTLLFFGIHCLAQRENEITVEAGFLQLKDALSQGMVDAIDRIVQNGRIYRDNFIK
jgi:hypothetical protein